MPTPPAHPGRCPRCHLRAEACLCAHIPVVDTRTRLVIVRHTLERKRPSNSGRIAHLALPNSELCTFGADDEVLPASAFTAPDTWLLFPEGEPHTAPPSPAPARLVVLDATWSQARRMRQRIARGLPILSLAPPPPRARMRTAPRPESMATLEAIAHALGLLEGEPARQALLELYDLMVDRASHPMRSSAP